MKKNIYIFSGLGADERIFKHLDFSNYMVNFIKWTLPQKDESIEGYASRIIDQIKDSNPTLIGISFGGMMAIEVSKQIDIEKVILIASAKKREEIPFYFRLIGKLRIHSFIPSKLLINSTKITYWLFGIKSKDEKELLKQIIYNTKPIFLKWAIDKIIKWQNTCQMKNLKHIHGSNDRILPFHFVNADFTIKKAGHLVPLTHPQELMDILAKEI